MNKLTALTLSAVSLLCLSACQPPEDDIACTEEARVSVSVEVVDAEGADILDAIVQFDAGDGAVDCESWDGVFACGTEIAGELEILISAPGFEDHSETVTVEADKCHVLSEDLRVELVEVAQ